MVVVCETCVAKWSKYSTAAVRVEGTMKKPLFNDEEVKLIQSAVLQVWDEVAYDVLQMVADEKGKRAEQVSIPRAEAMEVAMDAGRPEERLRQATRSWSKAKQEDLLTRWRQLDYGMKQQLVRPVFPYSRYGM